MPGVRSFGRGQILATFNPMLLLYSAADLDAAKAKLALHCSGDR